MQRALLSMILIVATFPVLAEERPHAASLPGVEEGYRIVDEDATVSSVAPDAEPETIPNAPGRYRVGDWDVHISGFVSYEIGTGRPRDGR